MKSLIRVVAVFGCLLAWRAECQYLPEGGGSGPYSTPAYSGDFGGTYVSPAFSGGSFGAPTAAGGGPGSGGAAERGFQNRPRYDSRDLGAYTSPAFSTPTLGIQVSPPVVVKPKPKSEPAPTGANAPVKPSGVSARQPDTSAGSTNRLDTPTAPPPSSTNAPPASGSTGPL